MGSDGFDNIKSALDSLAYIVTNPDCYKLSWDYPASFELKAGEIRKYEINATVKNSLMYLPEGDHLYYLGWDNSPPVAYSNTATAYSTDKEIIGTANTITDNTQARYDLSIGKRGFVDGIDINKEDDMYDMLPKTGGGFTWEMDNNLTVDSYMKTTDDVKITLNDVEFTGHGGECHLLNDDPSTMVTETDEGQQYIVWDEGFKAVLPAKTKLHIYITLTFPGESETWNAYTDAIKDNPTLFNTFYVYSMPDTVRHSLANPAKVLLQKGVYEVGHYTVDGQWGNLSSYYMDSDRYHYNNNDTEAERNKIKNVVTYYVIIRNTGTSRVYLSNIYDILPEDYEQREWSFVYNINKNEKKPQWSILARKADNEANSPPAGAVFGLYSPNKSDQMSVEDMEALGIDYTQFGQGQHEELIYYLLYVLETPENGVARFNELCEEAYVLLEIKAPDGYYGSTEPILIKRDSTAVATVTVENAKGAPLPGTGGYGLGSTIKLIALLLLSISVSGFAAIYLRKKR